MAARKSAGVTTVALSAATALRDWYSLGIERWPLAGPQAVNGFVVVHRGRRYRITVEREPCPPGAA